MRHRLSLSRMRCLTILLGSFTAIALAASWSSGQPEAFRLKERMSAADFERCGLQKLTPSELTALESWLARQAGGAESSPASAVQRFQSGAASSSLLQRLASFAWIDRPCEPLLVSAVPFTTFMPSRPGRCRPIWRTPSRTW